MKKFINGLVFWAIVALLVFGMAWLRSTDGDHAFWGSVVHSALLLGFMWFISWLCRRLTVTFGDNYLIPKVGWRGNKIEPLPFRTNLWALLVMGLFVVATPLVALFFYNQWLLWGVLLICGGVETVLFVVKCFKNRQFDLMLFMLAMVMFLSTAIIYSEMKPNLCCC